MIQINPSIDLVNTIQNDRLLQAAKRRARVRSLATPRRARREFAPVADGVGAPFARLTTENEYPVSRSSKDRRRAA